MASIPCSDVSLLTSAEINQEKIYENTKLVLVMKYVLLSYKNQIVKYKLGLWQVWPCYSGKCSSDTIQ